ncbi:MAG: dTDP-4-dehydrorhamnose reductase [Firmicutes bacterium]|nr:dTDP-4-dehydrorhamnose reductase [Bacillota bacterium]MCL5040700.1 dTDP-4-dehydrorhamnose reductase [Bacillota bacterium]
MRVLITGGKGQLGRQLAQTLREDSAEPAAKPGTGGVELFLYGHQELDITDPDLVQDVFRRGEPDVVIHCAAYTNVDGCERDPDLAFRINALGTRNVAVAAQKVGAKLIYISTDYVFDGFDEADGFTGSPELTGRARKRAYTEFDRTNPLSIYGRSKLAGEHYVLTLSRQAFIVRTSWLYGHGGNNFVRTMLRLARERKEELANGVAIDPLRVVDDQVGSPTYAGDLARVIAMLMRTELYGVYHVSNAGSTSWYEFTRNILGLAGLKGVPVVPIKTAELGRPAPRPAYSVLDNYCLRLEGFPTPRPWREALEEFLATEPD